MSRWAGGLGAIGLVVVVSCAERPATRASSQVEHARIAVSLPTYANAPTRIEERASHVGARFRLEGATNAKGVEDGELVRFSGGYRGVGDVVMRVSDEGVEDFVELRARPSREELTYTVDVSQAAGLRLVADTLELLDERGTPRVRVNPPWIRDANGERRPAHLALEGCSFDTSVHPPWDRPVTAPGQRECIMHVSWEAQAAYPLVVDPAWVGTGSMAEKRTRHAAALMANGKIIVVGGHDGGIEGPRPTPGGGRSVSYTFPTVATFFDPGSKTFAVGPTTGVRTNPSVTALPSGAVLIAGGGTSGQAVSTPTTVASTSAKLYDPTTGIADVQPLGVARQGHTATLLKSGNVLVTGGGTGTGSNDGQGAATSSAEVFDPVTKTWSPTANAMGSARLDHTAALLGDGRVLVVGGAGTSAELYDPSTNGFTPTGSLNTARGYARGALLLSGEVLVGGGGTSAERYDPATGLFTLTKGSMSVVRGRPVAIGTPSGAVIFVAGDPISPPSPSPFTSETYDPGTDGFGPNKTIATTPGHDGLAIATTPTGGVMVCGGAQLQFTNTGSPLGFLLDAAPAGAACSDASDCGTGPCLGGFCCASTACHAPCHACATGTGACTALTNVEDPGPLGCAGTKACDASAVCKLKSGQKCAPDAASCLSGFCVETYCCDTACDGGSCDRCDLAGHEGACTIADQGAPGASPGCATPLQCDGEHASCATCESDKGCAAGFFCAADGSCAPKRAVSDACDLDADCRTKGTCDVCTGGHCVDGFCCESACEGQCQACAATLKQSGLENGKCGPALEGTASLRGGACKVEGGCGADGKCSGTGGCRNYAPPTTACGPTTCTNNVVTGALCTGIDATCNEDAKNIPCGAWKCGGSACTSTCASDDDCSAEGYCVATACVPRRKNGLACTEGRECGSGFCVDGVCCNSTCTGQCEACDIAGAAGTCAPLTGPPHGARPACPAGDATNPCSAAQCDGTDRLSCGGFAGAQVACGSASCENGVERRASVCDSKGACKAVEPIACGAFACGANACKTECAGDADCAPGNTCDVTTKKCVSGATCDGDHTTTSANGTKVDCAPYKCQANGTCRNECTTVDDCVAPRVCDTGGKCVDAPASTPTQDGCSVGRGSTSGSFGGLALLALALLRARRSGGRRSRHACRPGGGGRCCG